MEYQNHHNRQIHGDRKLNKEWGAIKLLTEIIKNNRDDCMVL